MRRIIFSFLFALAFSTSPVSAQSSDAQSTCKLSLRAFGEINGRLKPGRDNKIDAYEAIEKLDDAIMFEKGKRITVESATLEADDTGTWSATLSGEPGKRMAQAADVTKVNKASPAGHKIELAEKLREALRKSLVSGNRIDVLGSCT